MVYVRISHGAYFLVYWTRSGPMDRNFLVLLVDLVVVVVVVVVDYDFSRNRFSLYSVDH